MRKKIEVEDIAEFIDASDSNDYFLKFDNLPSESRQEILSKIRALYPDKYKET